MKRYIFFSSRTIVEAEGRKVGGLWISVIQGKDTTVDPPLDGDERERPRLRVVLPIDPSRCHGVDMVQRPGKPCSPVSLHF